MGRAAGAGRAADVQDVVEAVAHKGLRAAFEIGNHGDEAGVVQPFWFNHYDVFVQVQRAAAAGGGEKAFGGLVDLIDKRPSERDGDVCGIARFQNFGYRDDFLQIKIQTALILEVRQTGQHRSGRNQNGGAHLLQRVQMLRQRRLHIEKAKRQKARIQRLIQIVVGAQEKGDALAEQPALRQHFGEHRRRPHRLLFGRGQKQAAMPRCTGRQTHGHVPDCGRKIAAALGFEGDFYRRFFADAYGVERVKVIHHQGFVHLKAGKVDAVAKIRRMPSEKFELPFERVLLPGGYGGAGSAGKPAGADKGREKQPQPVHKIPPMYSGVSWLTSTRMPSDWMVCSRAVLAR